MKTPMVVVRVATVCAAAMLLGCPGPRKPASTPATPATPPAARVPAKGSVELTMWTIWNTDPRKSALNEIVADFEKRNPGVKVTVSNLEPDAYKTKIRVALGGDAPPDVFFVWSGEKMLRSFIRGGNCLDITAALDANDGAWRKRIIASSLEPYVFEGRTYGIPYLLQCTFFFYNKDIFDAHGLTIPRTWTQLQTVCSKLKSAGITPIALGNLERWPAHHYPCVLFQRLMGHKAVMAQYDPLGPGDYANPGWVKGLLMFDDLYKMGVFNPSPNGVSRNDARMMFYTEKAAMFYTGTWDFSQLSEKGQAPSSFWNKWDFFNFPQVEGGLGEQDALAGSPDGYAISSKTRHPEQAIALLQHLTSVDVARQFVNECRELVQVQGAVTEDNANWYLRKYAEMVRNAPVISPWTDTVMEHSVAETLMNGVQGMLAGEKTADQIMQEVRKRQAAVKKEMLANKQAAAPATGAN